MSSITLERPVSRRSALGGRIRRLWDRQLPHYPDTAARTTYLGITVLATIVLYYQLYVQGSVATHVMRAYGFSFSQFVLVLVIGNAFGACASLFAGLADRWGRANLLVGGLLAVGLLAGVALPNAGSKTEYIAFFSLLSIVEGMALVATPALMRDFSPQVGRGTAMGLWTMRPVLGSLIVTMVSSYTLAGHPWQLQFQIAGAVGIGVALIALVGLRELSPGLRDQLMHSLRDRALIEARAAGIDPERQLPTMQAYSIAETRRSSQLHLVERPSALPVGAIGDGNVLNKLLVQLADLVADRVAAQLVAPARQRADDWLDTRRAAEYLGIGRDRLRRLAAERAIPTEQAGVGCKLYFRRSDLDEWRCSGSSPWSQWNGVMADSEGTARRVRVERGIYRRSTGVLEIGFKDETGRQRWRTVDGGILAARKVRDGLAARRARGESVAPKPKLRFGEAANCWLTGPVVDLRETTQVKYRCMVNQHLRPRFDGHRLDAVNADDLARLVRELRAEGMSEATIAVILGVVGAIYKFAARRLAWSGTIPTILMLRSERPKVSQTKRRPIFTGEQIEQTIAAAHEPYRTLFTVAALTGGRISELCALTWADVRIDDPGDAEIEFGWQVDRHGRRRPTKTDGSARTVPIPRELAVVLARHKLAARYCGQESFVFATCTGHRGAAAQTRRGRCARHSGAPSEQVGCRHSRSSMSSTRRVSPLRFRAGRCLRCIPSVTRWPRGRCWRGRVWTKSRSYSGIVTPM